MDSLASSSVDSSAKAHGLTGLLSSLDAALGNSTDAAAFAKFLQQRQNTQNLAQSSSQNSPQQTTTQTAQSSAPQAPAANSPTDNASIALIKKIVTGLHHILAQLNQHGGPKAPQGKSQENTDAKPVANNQAQAGNVQTPVNNASAQTQTAQQDPAVAADTTTSADASSSTVTDPLAQALAELVSLLQLIEKKIQPAQGDAALTSATQPVDPTQSVDPTQAAQNGNSADLTALDPTIPIDPLLQQLLALANATTNAQPEVTDPTTPASTDSTSNTDTNGTQTNTADNTQANAVDPLVQLLAFIQAIENKLTPADPLQSPASATVASASTQIPVTSTLDDFSGIRKDLKAISDLLQNAVANNNSNTDVLTPGTTDTSTNPVVGNNSTLNSAQFLKTTDLTQLSKTDIAAPINNLLNFFGTKPVDLSGTAPVTNSFATAAANGLVTDGSTDSKGDTFDFTKNDDAASGNFNSATALKVDTSIVPESIASTTPYSFASQLSDARAVNGGTTGLPSAVEQVFLQLNRGVKDGNEQMTIQLQPGDLGKVSIKLDISSDNKVQGTVVADNPATLNLLLKDVRSLERALQEAGLRADPGSLQFSLGGQSGNTSGQTAGNPGSGGSSGSNTSFNVADTSIDDSVGADETWVVTPGRVNFKV